MLESLPMRNTLNESPSFDLQSPPRSSDKDVTLDFNDRDNGRYTLFPVEIALAVPDVEGEDGINVKNTDGLGDHLKSQSRVMISFRREGSQRMSKEKGECLFLGKSHQYHTLERRQCQELVKSRMSEESGNRWRKVRHFAVFCKGSLRVFAAVFCKGSLRVFAAVFAREIQGR